MKPRGAFYVFAKLPPRVAPKDFIQGCIERELLVVPGGACSNRDTHLRISYAASEAKLLKAVEILVGLAKTFN